MAKTKLQIHEESDRTIHDELRSSVRNLHADLLVLKSRIDRWGAVFLFAGFLAANGLLDLSKFTSVKEAKAADVAGIEAR